MKKSTLNMGAVILAGGKSRRMDGIDKADLTIAGTTFLQTISNQLSLFDEVLLSVDRADRYHDCALPQVTDLYPGKGPLGGLLSALLQCQSAALLAVSVDMPLFNKGLAQYLQAFFHPGCDAVVSMTRDGRLHPLCAIYGKTAIPVLKECIAENCLRIQAAIARMNFVIAPLEHSAYGDEVLTNINTQKQYAELTRRIFGPPIIAVCGRKNSGKTTFLTRIIPLLVKKGMRVGVVKHDGHDFIPDVPGTDSYRLREAGAEKVAVYSEQRYMVNGLRNTSEPFNMLQHFRDIDLILMEGGKATEYPKIEIIREENCCTHVSNLSHLLFFCTDVEKTPGGAPVVSLHDYQEAAQRIVDFIAKS